MCTSGPGWSCWVFLVLPVVLAVVRGKKVFVWVLNGYGFGLCLPGDAPRRVVVRIARCLLPLVGRFIGVHSGDDFCIFEFESIVLIEAVSVLFPYLNLPSVSLTGLEHYFIALLLSVCTIVDGNLSHNMLVL